MDEAPTRPASKQLRGSTKPSLQEPRGGSIIDFGETRGAPRLYDAAHYALHQHQLGVETLPSLLDGYRQIAYVPPHPERHIALLGTLIGLRLLDLVADRDSDAYRQTPRDGVQRMGRMVQS